MLIWANVLPTRGSQPVVNEPTPHKSVDYRHLSEAF
jgi:hypothetical protein